MRPILLLFLTLILTLSLSARQKENIVNDTSKIELRRFNSDALNEYRSDRDFQYHELEAKGGLSLWSRFWTWFWNLFKSESGKKPSFKIPGFVWIALGVAALIFAIIKLSGMDAMKIFSRRSQRAPLDYSATNEDLNAIDFDAEINRATTANNYRLAVRLLYLRMLKYLSDARMIELQAEKTNSDYFKEIGNVNKKRMFGLLTRQFEYAWYGNFELDNSRYQLIETQFKEFYQVR